MCRGEGRTTAWVCKVIMVYVFSAYQKLLSWDPLLELVRLDGGGVSRKASYVGDEVHLNLTVCLHAPKVRLLILCDVSIYMRILVK